MQILNTYRDDSLDVDYVEPRLGHPLCALAALSGKASIALLLLQRGANPMARNMNGRTVLYIAVECGLEEVVRCITGTTHTLVPCSHTHSGYMRPLWIFNMFNTPF